MKPKFYNRSTQPSETRIALDRMEWFIGMVVDKMNTRAVCIGLEDYTRTDGVPTKLLVWKVELKDTKKTKIVKTTSGYLRIGDIPATKKAFE